MHAARAATPDDLGELARLLRLAVDVTPAKRGGRLFGQPGRQVDAGTRARNALAAENELLAAGTIDDVIFGVALAHVENELATIEELHVQRDARDVGVGEALLDFTVAWARANGAHAIDYPALPGDRATKNLGERSGFSARLIVMHRSL